MPSGTFAIEAQLRPFVRSTAGVRQAFVARIRSNATIRVALSGGIHEGFAPQKAATPFLVYQLIYAPIRRQWGAQQYIVGIDTRIYAENPVDASNIDELVLNELDDAALVIDGQSTLLCHRVADFSGPDVDEEGNKIAMVGGSYEIWSDQSF